MSKLAIAVCPGQSLDFVTLGICDGKINKAYLCHCCLPRIDLEPPFIIPTDALPGARTMTVETDCGCYDIYLHVTCPPVIIPGTFTGKTTTPTIVVCCDELPEV